MAAKTRHKVIATMIVARVPGAQGGEVYLTRGQLLPATVDSDEVKRLTGLGLVEKQAAARSGGSTKDDTKDESSGDDPETGAGSAGGEKTA